jgi:uncharacterized membrane protein
MNVPVALFFILLILMLAIGGKRGAKSIFTLVLNFIILFGMLKLMTFGFSPIGVTVIGCIIISSVTLFYINGFNKKTVSSLLSVMIVVFINIILTYKMGTSANIQGFGWEEAEAITGQSLYIHLDFSKIIICVFLIGLLGAIIDVSISISSAMNEIIKNNESITRSSLLKSGINIGKDILGTMTNTLLFAYIGGFMTFIVWFINLKYTISDIMNDKVFCAEVFQILSSGIGIILIIPVTAIISTMILFFKTPKARQSMVT